MTALECITNTFSKTEEYYVIAFKKVMHDLQMTLEFYPGHISAGEASSIEKPFSKASINTILFLCHIWDG